MVESDDEGFARAESALAALLSRGFLRPDASFTAMVQDGSFVRRLADLLDDSGSVSVAGALAALRSFSQEHADDDPEEARLMLEVDYNRLFVGPNSLLAPPYESYYESEGSCPGMGRLRSQAERDVVRLYVEQGFEVAQECVELPDHIAIELEYLSRLCAAEADAWARGDESEALGMQEAFAFFVEQHLGIWFGWFAQKINEGARYPFYPALALLVQECVVGDVCEGTEQ